MVSESPAYMKKGLCYMVKSLRYLMEGLCYLTKYRRNGCFHLELMVVI